MSNWMSDAFNGMVEVEKENNKLLGPGRFWVPPEGSKQFVFIDDEPAGIKEHNPNIRNTYRNWFTCLNGVHDDVPCCSTLGRPYYVGYFTIVDFSEYTDKRGVKHKYELKFLPAKLRTLKKLQRKKNSRASLINCLFTAHRDDPKSPNVGEEFEFEKEIPSDKLFEKVMYRGKLLSTLFTEASGDPDKIERLKRVFQIEVDENLVVAHKLVPFNYYELLQPRDPQAIRTLLANWTDEDNRQPPKKDSFTVDDVPF